MSASTSCNEIAEQVLGAALAGGSPSAAEAQSLAQHDCSDALFRIVVEGMADRFEPALCDAYAQFFSEVMAAVLPEYSSAQLHERYRRIRHARPCARQPDRVFILSRVTLGADIAVTSVLLQAAKTRFSNAAIVLVGSARNAELWTTDPRISHLEAPYPRSGSLRDRLEAGRGLAAMIDQPDSIVLDPDSRLSQLGLLPICDEASYFFFESRAWGGATNAALPELAAQWCAQVLGVSDAEPYLCFAVPKTPADNLQAAVSFGVGENLSKRVGGEFESGILRLLSEHGCRIVIDEGAGDAEAMRVREAQARAGVTAQLWRGSFAGFAKHIQSSGIYVGYDSAGQHAAAALGVPLVTVFRGQVSPRMFERWRPTGHGKIEVVDASALTEEEALRQAEAAILRIKKP